MSKAKKNKVVSFFKKNFFILFILFSSALIFSINIDKPFIGHHDWNSAWYSNFARNFTRYGLISAKFGSITNVGIVPSSEFNYFTHYPPLLPIFIFLSFKVFSIHEWSARMVPIIFSVWTILLIYILGVKFFDKKTALLSAAISSVLPITIYFSKIPVQEVVVIAPVLLSIVLYFRFFEKSDKKNFLKLVLSLALSHLINWPGYYVTPLFFFHYLIFSKKNKLIAFAFPLISIIMFAFHSLHLIWLTGKPLGGGMIEVLLFRLNMTEQPQGFSTFNFFKQQAVLLTVYFTRPVILFSIIVSFLITISLIRKKLSKPFQLLIMLGIFGITHNLVFQNMAYIHDYMIIYAWPFLVLSSSFCFFSILNIFKTSKTIQAILAAVLIFYIAFERIEFVKALNSSKGFSPGWEIGSYINIYTEQKEKSLIFSENAKENYEVFINYYSDRQVDYTINVNDTEKAIASGEYRLLIAVPSRDTPSKIVSILHNNLKETKINEFLIYDTKKRAEDAFNFCDNTCL